MSNSTLERLKVAIKALAPHLELRQPGIEGFV